MRPKRWKTGKIGALLQLNRRENSHVCRVGVHLHLLKVLRVEHSADRIAHVAGNCPARQRSFGYVWAHALVILSLGKMNAGGTISLHGAKKNAPPPPKTHAHVHKWAHATATRHRQPSTNEAAAHHRQTLPSQSRDRFVPEPDMQPAFGASSQRCDNTATASGAAEADTHRSDIFVETTANRSGFLRTVSCDLLHSIFCRPLHCRARFPTPTP